MVNRRRFLKRSNGILMGFGLAPLAGGILAETPLVDPSAGEPAVPALRRTTIASEPGWVVRHDLSDLAQQHLDGAIRKLGQFLASAHRPKADIPLAQRHCYLTDFTGTEFDPAQHEPLAVGMMAQWCHITRIGRAWDAIRSTVPIGPFDPPRVAAGDDSLVLINPATLMAFGNASTSANAFGRSIGPDHPLGLDRLGEFFILDNCREPTEPGKHLPEFIVPDGEFLHLRRVGISGKVPSSVRLAFVEGWEAVVEQCQAEPRRYRLVERYAVEVDPGQTRRFRLTMPSAGAA